MLLRYACPFLDGRCHGRVIGAQNSQHRVLKIKLPVATLDESLVFLRITSCERVMTSVINWNTPMSFCKVIERKFRTWLRKLNASGTKVKPKW